MQSFPKCQVEESLGVRWGLILCSLVFLIFSLMLVTEINFLLWIGICFPIDMHSFLVAISKGWCSNITVFVKKIISQDMLREGLIFPSYLTVTESIMKVFFQFSSK